jgi:DNA-binding GntR family transcriptional regulator
VRLPDPSVTVRSLTMLLHLRGATTSDIYDARMIFEPPAVRLAAENVTPEQIERLREVLDEGLAAMHANQLSYPIVGWRFHTELVAISGNATLAVMAETFEHISAHHAVQVGRLGRELQRAGAPCRAPPR